MRKGLTILVSVVVLSAAMFAQKKPAQRNPNVRVTSVQLHVDPVFRNYKGACPVRVIFNGAITTNGATDVGYTFEASDGRRFTGHRLQFRGNGTLATDQQAWEVGHDFSGWLALKPAAPFNYIESTRAFFTVKCTGNLRGR
jgi:hypothetical protein